MLISSLFSISLLWSSLSFGCTDGAGSFWKTIVVDQSGHGDFTTVQSAVNSVPDGNRDWVRIHVKRGTYKFVYIALLFPCRVPVVFSIQLRKLSNELKLM